MAGGADDLALNTNVRQEVAALFGADDGVALKLYLGVIVLRLGMPAHEWDSVDLSVYDDEPNAEALQVLNSTGVVDVVVCRQLVGDLRHVDTHDLAGMLHHADRAGPARIHEEPWRVICQQI